MLLSTLRWRAILAAVILLVTGICDAQSTTTSSTSSVNDLEDTAFIGYYVQPTTVQRLAAGGGKSWVTSASYAADCSGTSCNFPTGCGSNTLTYGNGDKEDCGDSASCVAFTIFQTSPYGLPSAMNYGCRVGWSAFTVYRANPATATATSTSASSATSSTLSTQITSAASLTTTISSTVPTEPATETSTPAVSASSSSDSKAWIAGAVIGPIAGIALIGLAAWLLLRKKRYEPVVAATEADGQQKQQEYYAPANDPQPTEMEARQKPWPQEMPAGQEPVELPSQQWHRGD